MNSGYFILFTYPLDEGFGSVYVKHARCGFPYHGLFYSLMSCYYVFIIQMMLK